MIKKCKWCGKEFERTCNSQKYCSDGCRNAMKQVYNKRRRECRRKNTGGWARISKNIVKAPPECAGQTTCLECSLEKCIHE